MNNGVGLVLDLGQIDRLAVELNSRSYAEGFVGRFLENLPERLARIQRSLLEGRSESALVAILSVATSAAMAGAIQLEGRTRSIELSIRAGDLAAARDAAGALDTNAADFARQVGALLSFSAPVPRGQQEFRRSKTA
jgi:HPt (histidine-containing phosphotransfer) domain-containing protein